jgi:hypothetical protein
MQAAYNRLADAWGRRPKTEDGRPKTEPKTESDSDGILARRRQFREKP